MKDLGEIVKAERTRSGVSQRSLARRAGTTQASISRIEAGLEEPGYERFTQIMAALGLIPDLSLAPIASHDADLARLAEQRRLMPQERLDDGLAWIEFSRDLLGTAKRA